MYVIFREVSPGWEFGCSCGGMDRWWDCIDFINGRGEETWYGNLWLLLLCSCRFFVLVLGIPAYYSSLQK